MSFDKRKGISVMAIILLLAIFNVVVFLLPIPHSITFWLGYSFTTLAGLLFLVCILFLFDSEDNNRMFLRLPVSKLGWIYLVLQTIVGILQILNFAMPYFIALIANCCLTGFFIITMLASQAAGESIERQNAHIAEKVLFLKKMQGILASIKIEDAETRKKIERLQEDFRFSDPMSHSTLSELEKQIESKIIMMKSNISDNIFDKEKTDDEIECISDLLKVRNQKCKMLKNVKEEKTETDTSGIKYVALTISILSVLATVALVIGFVIVPSNKYKTAMALYENESFDEAIEAFTKLASYKDSIEMIETVKDAVKEKRYLEAQNLFEDKKYEEAIAAFEELDTYKDSKEMIESVKQTVTENKYGLAEKYFNDQNYLDAIKIYQELGDYKDCTQKIEQINNRLSEDDVVYFGSYKNQPIAWQVIESDNDKMLLISKDPVCELPYNDEIKNIRWNESSLCKWLNGEFIASFSEDQYAQILTQKIDGEDAKVFLMSQKEAEDLEDSSVLMCSTDWWMRTKADNNAIYVSLDADIIEDGETVVRAKGVRPCIWINLK